METLFKNISVNQTKQLIEAGATLADIRDPDSFAAGHIEGATQLSNDNLHEFIQQADLDKPLVVYCYHGHSSQPAVQFLAEQGFEEVYSMIGGYSEWQ